MNTITSPPLQHSSPDHHPSEQPRPRISPTPHPCPYHTCTITPTSVFPPNPGFLSSPTRYIFQHTLPPTSRPPTPTPETFSRPIPPALSSVLTSPLLPPLISNPNPPISTVRFQLPACWEGEEMDLNVAQGYCKERLIVSGEKDGGIGREV